MSSSWISPIFSMMWHTCQIRRPRTRPMCNNRNRLFSGCLNNRGMIWESRSICNPPAIHHSVRKISSHLRTHSKLQMRYRRLWASKTPLRAKVSDRPLLNCMTRVQPSAIRSRVFNRMRYNQAPPPKMPMIAHQMATRQKVKLRNTRLKQFNKNWKMKRPKLIKSINSKLMHWRQRANRIIRWRNGW